MLVRNFIFLLRIFVEMIMICLLVDLCFGDSSDKAINIISLSLDKPTAFPISGLIRNDAVDEKINENSNKITVKNIVRTETDPADETKTKTDVTTNDGSVNKTGKKKKKKKGKKREKNIEMKQDDGTNKRIDENGGQNTDAVVDEKQEQVLISPPENTLNTSASTTPEGGLGVDDDGSHYTTRQAKKCRGLKCRSSKAQTTDQTTTPLLFTNPKPTTPFYIFDGVDYRDDELFAQESMDCEGRYVTCAVDSERIYPVCAYYALAVQGGNPYFTYQSQCDMEYNNCIYRMNFFKLGAEGVAIDNNLYELVAMYNCDRRPKKYKKKTEGLGSLDWPYDED